MKPSHIIKTALISGALVLTTLPLSPAQANSGVQLGQLNCVVAGGIGFVFGSSKDLDCTFTPADSQSASEKYKGTIKKFGIDIGFTGETVILWTVVAVEKEQTAPGALAGSYSGIGTESTFGVGLGANALVGGSGQSFALQPLSISAGTGVNAALAFQQITLNPQS